MTFDWTVNLGHLLTIAGFIVVALGVFYGVRSDVGLLSQRLGSVEKDLAKIDQTLEQIVKIFVELARQEERLGAMDRRMNDHNNRLLVLERNEDGR